MPRFRTDPGAVPHVDKMKMYTEEERKMRMDQGFKTLIHDTKVLPMILKSNIDELKDRSLEEILSCLDVGEDGRTVIGKDTEDRSVDSGRIEMDSVFEVTIPGEDPISVIVNVEGQNNPRPRYPLLNRAEYYVSRLVTSQKGTVFKGDDYGKLQKVYSIWYILDPLARDRNTITGYSRKAENILGPAGREMAEMGISNVLFINVGDYEEGLPDSMAFAAVLFSHMSDMKRREIMKDRFNIEFDDILHKGVDDMAGIGQDTFDKGFDRGYEKAEVDFIVTLVSKKGLDLDSAMKMIEIPDDKVGFVRNEALKRLD